MSAFTTRAPAGEALDLADTWHRLMADERRCRAVIVAKAWDADALGDWCT